MPIEIRELVIRTVVGPDTSGSSSDGGGSGQAPAPISAESFEQLVQECVRQVLLALARERDR